MVLTEYFELGSQLYIERAEWRVMREQRLRPRIVDIRVTENLVRVRNTLPSAALI